MFRVWGLGFRVWGLGFGVEGFCFIVGDIFKIFNFIPYWEFNMTKM